MRFVACFLICLLAGAPEVWGNPLEERLAQRREAAERECESHNLRLVQELQPAAAQIWKQLEALAGPDETGKLAAQRVKELVAELARHPAVQLQTRDDFQRYDQLVRERGMAQRALEAAQANRQSAVRTAAEKSEAGQRLLKQWRAAEAQVAAERRELNLATARLATVTTRIKNYAAPPPPPGKSSGSGELLVLKPPADEVRRRQQFAERNAPDRVDALAQAFFARVNVNSPGLEQVRQELAAGRKAQALEAWRDAFFARLKDPQAHGLPANWGGDLDTASLLRRPDERRLAEALEHVYSTPRAKARVGLPGAIPWADPGPDPAADPLRNAYLDFYTLRGQGGFVDVLGPHLILLEGYAATGDSRYLTRWAEVLDDWALNAPADMERSPFAIRQYPVLCSFRPVALASTLTDVLEAQPDFARLLPAPTLARILLAVMEEYPAAFVRMGRRGIYNWRCIAITGAVLTAQAFPEFEAAQWQLAEAKRLMELNWSHKILRDGANLEQGNWGHEPNDQVHLGRAWQLLETAPPVWLDDAWRAEWTDNVKVNARYYLHTLKPDGYTYRFSRVSTADKLDLNNRLGNEPLPIQVNLLLNEPEALRRLHGVFGAGQGGAPQVASESLAWFGASVFRESWQPDAAFLYFQSSPHRDMGGREDANGFAWHAGGHALLLAPPLAVDDRTQNIHYGLVRDPGGKTVYLAHDEREQPVAARFHASNQFDFTEGSYAGVYQFHRGPEAEVFGDYGYLKLGEARRKAGEPDEPVRDVKHFRQVLSLRGEQMVVITDRWQSERERTFTQNYTLFTPVPREGWRQRIELARQQGRPALVVDGPGCRLRTENGSLPGLALRHFGARPPSYAVTQNAFDQPGDAQSADEALAALGSPKLKKWTMGLPLPFFYKVRADWKTQGEQVLVTALTTLPGDGGTLPAGSDMQAVEEIAGTGIAGFRAITARGAKVTYVAAARQARLEAAPLAVEGESLVVVEREGKITGLVLGAERCELAGIAQPHTGDFEFIVAGNRLEVTPIYSPMQPVEILPAVSVFRETQSVELRCGTPGAEIRYTLDGSDPTLKSPLYGQPLVLNSTTRLKARAFRPGLASEPWTADGTQATVVSWATFEKQPEFPSASALQPQPGLAWEYFEGRWAELFVNLDHLVPRKKGVSRKLLDIAPRETSGAFAIRASGWLRVPATGVYTFYAPSEWMLPNNECGYELRVEIHNRPWQPATRRHAHGTWSVPLQAGWHPLRVTFIDFRPRTHKPELWDGFPHADIVWRGEVPRLELSGPEGVRIPVPEDWLWHTP